MKVDPLLTIALSVYHNPGVYALLLGSGVSRGAGIPTGWEVVTDLIRKLSVVQNGQEPKDPAAWYREQFGKEPSYSEIMGKLAGTPSERQQLLQPYFEPQSEEEEQGIKVPNKAHRGIARLVKDGWIRVILTTNFDRLLEAALADEGVIADVVSTPDQARGAVPFVHSKCYLVKLHGDYRDTRLLNTEDEVGEYPEEINQLLDRVLDEHGLIVCGWSAEWDKALRDALLRAPGRRYTTYWLARGDLTTQARELVTHRRAVVASIESADEFFASLGERVQALKDSQKPHPMEVFTAIATVERYAADTQHRVRLHNLINDEVEHVRRELSLHTRPGKYSVPTSRELVMQRIRECEEVSERLLGELAALAHHDTGENASLLSDAIQRLASHARQEVDSVSYALCFYPALLAMYASGLSALAAGRYANLFHVLCRPRCRCDQIHLRGPAIKAVNVWKVLSPCKDALPTRQSLSGESDYLYQQLRSSLARHIPDDANYALCFDVFEFLAGLVYADIVDMEDHYWAPGGRFAHRWWHDWRSSPMQELVEEVQAQGPDHPLLRTGFFSASTDRLHAIAEEYRRWVGQVARG